MKMKEWFRNMAFSFSMFEKEGLAHSLAIVHRSLDMQNSK